MNQFDFIDGWTIGEDGYWKPKPCQLCGGSKAVSRSANQDSPRERGYVDWHQPCPRCSNEGLVQFANWIRSVAPDGGKP